VSGSWPRRYLRILAARRPLLRQVQLRLPAPAVRRGTRQELRDITRRGRHNRQAVTAVLLRTHPARERHLQEQAYDGCRCRPYTVTFSPPIELSPGRQYVTINGTVTDVGPAPPPHLRTPLPEHVCPDCRVERADFEGPGWHLPSCPNCGSTADPVPAAGLS
jgi:hypothetical protein